MIRSISTLLFIYFIGLAEISGQNPTIKRIGIPFIQSYTPADYGLSHQNFDVLIGDDKKMYFANISGILVYDGTHWINVKLPNNDGAYSLTKTADGTIYVGGVNEIGYLSKTANGELTYVSLAEKLEGQVGSGFTSWNNWPANDQVVFSTFKQIFVYNHKTGAMNVVDCPFAWAGMMVNNDIIYSFQADTLYTLEQNKWKALRCSKLLSEGLYSRVLLIPTGQEHTLAINNDGYFDFQTETRLEISEDVSEFLKSTTLIGGKLLFDQYIVLTTWSGILITDLQGNAVQLFNKNRGSIDELMFHVDLDNQGGLWAASNGGIYRFEISTPYSIIDSEGQLDGLRSGAALLGNQLYISTFTGISRTDWDKLQNPLKTAVFDKVNYNITHGFIKSSNELISLTEGTSNIFINSEGKLSEIEETEVKLYWRGFMSATNDHAFLGSTDGSLLHLKRINDKWVPAKKMNLKIPQIQYIVEGNGNDIWVSSIGQGLYKLSYNKQSLKLTSEIEYTHTRGLPDGKDVQVFNAGELTLFNTEKGIYEYVPEQDTFVINRLFDGNNEMAIRPFLNNHQGDIFYISDAFYTLSKNVDGYQKSTIPFLDPKMYPTNDISFIDDNNIIVSTNNAIIHIDPKQNAPNSEFEVILTKIWSLTKESLIFGGFGDFQSELITAPDENSIRFEFSSTYFQNIEQNEFSWRLNGSNWSAWSRETTKDYTNIPHGNHTFEVMSRNYIGKQSQPMKFSFTVGTPWYFTLPAYLLYLGIITLIIWLIVVIYTRKLRHDRDRLENIITDRTKEISQQKDKLIQLDNLKSRFFLNLSHELRTPLTLSMGTVSQTLKEKYGPINEDQKQHLSTSLRNSERLIKMINEILDISKLESGKMELQLSQVNIAHVVNRISELFNSKFHGKQITFNRLISSDSELLVDVAKVETIIVNLLSNAFKFTPDQGQINITLTEDDSQMLISIQDDGVGIREADLPYVFDRFYQVENSASQSGTGIGLALCKELMELHHGSIKLQSKPNDTRFILVFRKGQKHFTSDQIANIATPIEENEHSLLIDASPRESSNNNTETQNEALTSGGHILIVEDNPELKDFLIELLSDTYHVSHVGDGQQALDFLHKTHPDLILSDYMMPVMDGLEMTKIIKQTDALAQIPLIFLTARAEERDKISVLNLGVDDYLFKPFNPDELAARVRNLLQRQQQRQDFIEETIIDSKDIEWKEFSLDLKASVDAYIADHLKEEITGEQLASATNQSERSLYRKVKANTGLSLMNYVKEYRLREARYFLENGTFKTVSEVSYAVGFNYLSHFTKSYKERFGKQPSEYLE